MKRISLVLLMAFVVVSFSGHVLARENYKEDVCKVVAYSDWDFKESDAQYAAIPKTTGISQECLSFAQGSTLGRACANSKGEAQIYQIRWVMPKTGGLASHCHYKCLGEPDSACDDKCMSKPAQIPTQIGTVPCP